MASKSVSAVTVAGMLFVLASCRVPFDGVLTSDKTALSGATTAGTATAALAGLPVKGRAAKSGYSRAQFGPAWTDDNSDPLGRNGCDTRNDLIKIRLLDVVMRSGSRCIVASGTLHDPYTGKTIEFVRGPQSAAIQADHTVALGDAWQTGAQQLTAAERVDYANDPLVLLMVDGQANEAKGDGDAATWLPPNKAYRCAYVARQVAVKVKYHLWVTAAEKTAIGHVLSSCPQQLLPTEHSSDVVGGEQ